MAVLGPCAKFLNGKVSQIGNKYAKYGRKKFNKNQGENKSL